MREPNLADIYQADIPAWLAEVKPWIGFINGTDADKFLEHNIEPQIGVVGSNRKSQPYLVQQFADIILNGEWEFSHQGVAFDTDGKLIDGAHRLKGLQLAAKTDPEVEVPIIVWYNVPSSRTVDVVRRRSLADVLTMKGYPNTNVLAAAGRLCYIFEKADWTKPWSNAYWSSTRPNRTVLEDWIATNREAMDEAVRVGSQLSALFTPTGAAAAYYVCKKEFPNADIAGFLVGVRYGEELKRTDPRFALRSWAINRRDDGSHSVGYEHMAVIIKAFNAYREGRPLQIMRWAPASENFPRP